MSAILIVDDDRAAAEVLRIRLANAGHEAVVAFGGKDAIRKYESTKPLLVLLDAAMSDVSGFDVGQYIRQNDPGHRVTVVYVSGASMPSSDYVKRCAEFCGGDMFVPKPYDFRVILDIVERVLEPAA